MKKTVKGYLAFILALCLILSVFVVPASAKDDAEVIKGFMRERILFEDLAKLLDAVKTNDGVKIFMCVLETYPDYVAGLKKHMAEDPGTGKKEASVISGGDIVLFYVLTVVIAAALGVFITYGIMRNKMKKLKALAADTNKKE